MLLSQVPVFMPLKKKMLFFIPQNIVINKIYEHNFIKKGYVTIAKGVCYYRKRGMLVSQKGYVTVA